MTVHQANGGSSGTTTDAASGQAGEPGKVETVAYETYSKLLGEKKATQERLKVIEAEAAALKKEKQDAEEAKLKEQGQYKTILEQREKELASEKSAREKLQNRVLDSVKFNAFQEKLGGKLKRPEYADFVPFDKIAINPETMAIDEGTLADAVQTFTAAYADLVDYGNKRSLPGDAPKGTKALSYEDWLKLPLKDQKAKMHLFTKKK